MGRFDYVKYNETAAAVQAHLKQKFEELEKDMEVLGQGRAQSLIMTKLEEAYMWVGKAIRDAQVKAEQGTELQEGRTNS